MHLFCLLFGALAIGITDGRISSSSSSSSSKPVAGSAVEVTPLNQRELEPAIEYCTAIDRIDGDGKQRGVVDWQGIDQCHKCEGGQPWWPCDSDLCIGSCTPEAVCDERLKVAAAKAAAASDDTTSTLLIESLRKQLRDSKDKIDYYRSQISDVAAEKNIEIDSLTASSAATIKTLEEIIAENDSSIAALSLQIKNLEDRLATTSPTTSPTKSPTDSPTKLPTDVTTTAPSTVVATDSDCSTLNEDVSEIIQNNPCGLFRALLAQQVALEDRIVFLEPFTGLQKINDQKEAIIADLSVQVCSSRCAVSYKENGPYVDSCSNERDSRLCTFQACTAVCKQSFYGTTEIEPVWYVDNNNELMENILNYRAARIGQEVYVNYEEIGDDYNSGSSKNWLFLFN